jgi:hypothetical protein
MYACMVSQDSVLSLFVCVLNTKLHSRILTVQTHKYALCMSLTTTHGPDGVFMCVCVYVCISAHGVLPGWDACIRIQPFEIYACMRIKLYACMRIKLIAFELAGEDRDRRENPVLSRLKTAFFALHKRG